MRNAWERRNLKFRMVASHCQRRSPSRHTRLQARRRTSAPSGIRGTLQQDTIEGIMNEDHAPTISAALAAAAGRTGDRIPASRYAASLATVAIARAAATNERVLVITASGERARSIRQTLRRAGLDVHLPGGEEHLKPPAGSVTVSSASRLHLTEAEPDITILDLTGTMDLNKNAAAEKHARGAHVILTAERHREAPATATPADSGMQQRRGTGKPTLKRRVVVDHLP